MSSSASTADSKPCSPTASTSNPLCGTVPRRSASTTSRRRRGLSAVISVARTGRAEVNVEQYGLAVGVAVEHGVLLHIEQSLNLGQRTAELYDCQPHRGSHRLRVEPAVGRGQQGGQQPAHLVILYQETRGPAALLGISIGGKNRCGQLRGSAHGRFFGHDVEERRPLVAGLAARRHDRWNNRGRGGGRYRLRRRSTPPRRRLRGSQPPALESLAGDEDGVRYNNLGRCRAAVVASLDRPVPEPLVDGEDRVTVVQQKAATAHPNLALHSRRRSTVCPRSVARRGHHRREATLSALCHMPVVGGQHDDAPGAAGPVEQWTMVLDRIGCPLCTAGIRSVERVVDGVQEAGY